MALFDSLGKYKNFGLLLIRVGLGIMFIWHGLPKLMSGPESWKEIGGSAKYIGLNFLPMLWGFLSVATEAIGGLFFLIGFVFRPVCVLMIINLIVAALSHIKGGEGLMGASHAIEDAITFAGLFIIGPGRYSVDKK